MTPKPQHRIPRKMVADTEFEHPSATEPMENDILCSWQLVVDHHRNSTIDKNPQAVISVKPDMIQLVAGTF